MELSSDLFEGASKAFSASLRGPRPAFTAGRARRDSDELVSSGALACPVAASRCDARAGAFGLTSEYFRPRPNLLPSLGALALSSLLVCVAIKHLPKKRKGRSDLSLPE